MPSKTHEHNSTCHAACQGSHEHEHEEDPEELERAALCRIVRAFKDYKGDAQWEVARWEYNYNMLKDAHKKLLEGQVQRFTEARRCIEVNQFFINSLLYAFDPSGEIGKPLPSGEKEHATARKQSGDVEKVRYVLKNLVRDWAAEGAEERAASYGRILDELKACFQSRPEGSPKPRVLVPGAGLARLCCEVAGLGYEVQGNEFSYFMLLTSSFILNHMAEGVQYTVHPWVTTSCNVVKTAHQLAPVIIPDTPPEKIVKEPGLMSMCAGDFVEVYSDPGYKESFDCVVTCFFIDTAHNVLEYLEVIHSVLEKGGKWINLGPLLYHWADSHTYLESMELSIEVSLEEIRNASEKLGFKLLQETNFDASYIANMNSMYKTVYQACFWTMEKV